MSKASAGECFDVKLCHPIGRLSEDLESFHLSDDVSCAFLFDVVQALSHLNQGDRLSTISIEVASKLRSGVVDVDDCVFDCHCRSLVSELDFLVAILDDDPRGLPVEFAAATLSDMGKDALSRLVMIDVSGDRSRKRCERAIAPAAVAAEA
jgi:hypothetical protein